MRAITTRDGDVMRLMVSTKRHHSNESQTP